MTNEWVRARAPATIANVGPGFDVFALAIRGPEDHVAIRTAHRDSLAVEGVGADLVPADFSENTAGIVIEALRSATDITTPLDVRLRKGIPPARGLGSSAASCAAAAIAFLRAFPDSRSLGLAGFLRAAVEGEAAVSGRHYDNVAGSLLGGFVTIASTEPLVLRREPVSPRVHIALAVPEIVLRTAAMRKILPDWVPLRDAVSNVGRAATLALALAHGDVALAGRCLEDRLAEPARAPSVTGYTEARAAATAAHASGFAISGSGSTVFALARNRAMATEAAKAMCAAFGRRGVRATPLVTAVTNVVPLREFAPRAGAGFSVVEGFPVRREAAAREALPRA
jgi:homoserine kinase